MKRKLLVLFCIVLCLTASGCGKRNVTVPDSKIQYYVDNYLVERGIEDKATGYTWHAQHSPDKTVHTDKVALEIEVSGEYGTEKSKCNVTYVYDKASDLWNIIDKSDWTDAEYTYNSSLLGRWSISRYGNNYDITAWEIKNGTIELSCDIREVVYGGLYSGNVECHAYGEGIFDIDEYIKVYFDLPDRFFSSWTNTESGQNEQYAKLTIHLDPYAGIDDAFIFDNICYSD